MSNSQCVCLICSSTLKSNEILDAPPPPSPQPQQSSYVTTQHSHITPLKQTQPLLHRGIPPWPTLRRNPHRRLHQILHLRRPNVTCNNVIYTRPRPSRQQNLPPPAPSLRLPHLLLIYAPQAQQQALGIACAPATAPPDDRYDTHKDVLQRRLAPA